MDSPRHHSSIVDDRVGREAEFHDLWAHSVDPSTVLVGETFQLPSCPENRWIAERLGDVSGKTLLELGTGQGEAAVYFATKGAKVIATDISPGMLELTQKVASFHGASVDCRVMEAVTLAFPDNSFDIVYGANVLHHVDTEACLREVYRVLKPGGIAAFWDPIKYNPVINCYRRMATEVRTEDEHPLGRSDLELMQRRFGSVEVRFFWLLTLVVFLKFYFVDRISPNQERYWKKIVNDYPKIQKLYEALLPIDRLLLRIPGIRWLAWNMVVILRK